MCDKKAEWFIFKADGTPLAACPGHAEIALGFAWSEGQVSRLQVARIDPQAAQILCGYREPSGAVQCDFKTEASVSKPRISPESRCEIRASAGLGVIPPH